MEEGIQHAKTPPKVSWANEVQPERELSVKQISARFKGSSVPITEADFQRKLRAYRKIPSFATVQRNKIKNFKSPKKHLLMKEWSQIVESENVGVVDSESALDFLAHYDVTPNDMDAESWKEWLEAIESATTNINDGRRASLSLQADEANAVVQSVGGDSTNSENNRNFAIEINTNFSKDDTNQASSNTGDSDSFSPLPTQLKPHHNNLTSDLEREEIALAPTPSAGGDGGDGEKSNATADNRKDSTTSNNTHNASYDPQTDSIHMGETEDTTNIVDHQQQRVEEQEEGDEEQEEVNYESIDATMVDYTSDFSENNTPSRTPAHTPPHSPKHAEDGTVASFESTHPQSNKRVAGSAPVTVALEEPSEQMSTSIGREDYVTDCSTESSASPAPITGATSSAKDTGPSHTADETANPLLHKQHVSDVSPRKENRANTTTMDTDTSDDAAVVTSILHQQPERQPADTHPLGTVPASGVASGEVESGSGADKSISTTATTATTTNSGTTQQSTASTPAIPDTTSDSSAAISAAPEEEEEMPSKVRSKSFGVEMEKQNEQPAPGFFSCCFGSGRNKKKQKKAAARKEQLLRPMSRKSHIAGL